MSDLTLARSREELKTLLKIWCPNVSEIIDSVDDSAKKCWVDRDNCSYGNPNGKFSEAPLGFCKECRIAENHMEELRDLFEEKVRLEEEELEQGIREDIAVNSISVKDLLNKLAEEACSGKAQKELKKILKEFIDVVSRELKLGMEMVIEEDEVYKKQEIKKEII